MKAGFTEDCEDLQKMQSTMAQYGFQGNIIVAIAKADRKDLRDIEEKSIESINKAREIYKAYLMSLTKLRKKIARLFSCKKAPIIQWFECNMY